MGGIHLDDLRSTSMGNGVPFVMTTLIRQMPLLPANSLVSRELSHTGQVPVEGILSIVLKITLINAWFVYVGSIQDQDQFGLMTFSVEPPTQG